MTGVGLEEVVSKALQEAISYTWGSRFHHLFCLSVLPTLIIIHQDGKRKIKTTREAKIELKQTGEWMKDRDSEKVSVALNALS